MIYVLSGSDVHIYPNLMDEVHSFRHAIFVKEMGWRDLDRPDKREIDEFDHDEAVHLICVRNDRVAGYARMLPTTRAHLLSHVLPFLCEGERPCGETIWEMTRYSVAPAHREGRRGVSSVGSEIIAGVVEWGLNADNRNVIIEFETIWILRLLQLRFLVRPLGFETVVGTQKVVAALASFDSNTLQAVRRYRGYDASVTAYINGDDAIEDRIAV